MIWKIDIISLIRFVRQQYIDLSDVMSTRPIIMLTSDFYVDLSDNFVVICMALTGQEHVFKIYFLTNK